MRQRWQLHRDRVVGSNLAAGHDHRHDTGLADERTAGVAVEHRSHQAGLELIQLYARVAEPRDVENRRIPDSQPGARGEPEQVDPACRDVLTHVSRHHSESLGSQLVVKLGVNQMHLAEIRLGRITGHPRTVLNRPATVGISLHSEAGQQVDAILIGLAEGVTLSPAYRNDETSLLAASGCRHHEREPIVA
jgi:hypothetical protein